MISQYGPGGPIGVRQALLLAGWPSDLSEDDAYARVHRDQEAADAWARANLEWHDAPLVGQHRLADGTVINVYDLRPQLRRLREGQ
jgi:hypothetical protein